MLKYLLGRVDCQNSDEGMAAHNIVELISGGVKGKY